MVARLPFIEGGVLNRGELDRGALLIEGVTDEVGLSVGVGGHHSVTGVPSWADVEATHRGSRQILRCHGVHEHVACSVDEVALGHKDWLGAIGCSHDKVFLLCLAVADDAVAVTLLYLFMFHDFIKDTLLSVMVVGEEFVVLHSMEDLLVVKGLGQLLGHILHRRHRVAVHEA